MQKIVSIMLVSTILGGDTGYASGLQEAVKKIGLKRVDDLGSNDPATTVERELQTAQTHLVSLLRKTVETEEEEFGLQSAMRLLGEMRSMEAIEPLVKYLDYAPVDVVHHRDTYTYEHFPAAMALVRIGLPAWDDIAKRLADPSSSEVEMHVGVWVLYRGQRWMWREHTENYVREQAKSYLVKCSELRRGDEARRLLLAAKLVDKVADSKRSPYSIEEFSEHLRTRLSTLPLAEPTERESFFE